jgi:O-antigen/teichoic acid export membrane protein
VVFGLTAVPGALLYATTYNADRVLTGFFLHASDVAVLSLALSMSATILVLKQWFAMVWEPYVARWIASEAPTSYVPRLRAAVWCILVFSVWAMLCSAVWADVAIGLLFPPSYLPASRLVPIIVLTGALGSLSSVAVATAIIGRTARFHVVVNAVGLIVNVAVACYALPRFGMVGAVLGAVAGELAILAGWAAVGNRVLKNLPLSWGVPFLAILGALGLALAYRPGVLMSGAVLVERLLVTTAGTALAVAAGLPLYRHLRRMIAAAQA